MPIRLFTIATLCLTLGCSDSASEQPGDTTTTSQDATAEDAPEDTPTADTREDTSEPDLREDDTREDVMSGDSASEDTSADSADTSLDVPGDIAQDTSVDVADTPDTSADVIEDTAQDSSTDTNTTDVAQDTTGPACPPDLSAVQPAEGQLLIIESVDFVTDTVHVRNVSAGVVRFSRERDRAQPLWRIGVQTEANLRDLPTNYSIDPGARVRIHLRDTGQDSATDIYLGWSTNLSADLRPEVLNGSEIAILRPYDTNDDPAALVAYVRWGNDDSFGAGRTYRDQAAAATRWIGDINGDYVITTETSLGVHLVPGGEVIDPDLGWTETTERDCLQP